MGEVHLKSWSDYRRMSRFILYSLVLKLCFEPSLAVIDTKLKYFHVSNEALCPYYNITNIQSSSEVSIELMNLT